MWRSHPYNIRKKPQDTARRLSGKAPRHCRILRGFILFSTLRWPKAHLPKPRGFALPCGARGVARRASLRNGLCEQEWCVSALPKSRPNHASSGRPESLAGLSAGVGRGCSVGRQPQAAPAFPCPEGAGREARRALRQAHREPHSPTKNAPRFRKTAGRSFMRRVRQF